MGGGILRKAWGLEACFSSVQFSFTSIHIEFGDSTVKTFDFNPNLKKKNVSFRLKYFFVLVSFFFKNVQNIWEWIKFFWQCPMFKLLNQHFL